MFQEICPTSLPTIPIFLILPLKNSDDVALRSYVLSVPTVDVAVKEIDVVVVVRQDRNVTRSPMLEGGDGVLSIEALSLLQITDILVADLGLMLIGLTVVLPGVLSLLLRCWQNARAHVHVVRNQPATFELQSLRTPMKPYAELCFLKPTWTGI